MKIEIPINKRSVFTNKLHKRKRYEQWLTRTKEAAVYKAVLFAICRGVCPDCGINMVLSFDEKFNQLPNAATLDHTIPIASIIKDHKYGLQILCKKCNNGKIEATKK